MNPGITLWKIDPLYPKPGLPVLLKENDSVRNIYKNIAQKESYPGDNLQYI